MNTSGVNKTITHENDITTVELIRYLRKDFVSTLLRIKVKNNKLLSLFFHSNNYGIAEWENGRGIVHCNRWENEDQAQSQSYLSRHYTSIVLNGAQSTEYAHSEIIPDVCSSFKKELISEIAENAALHDFYGNTVDVNSL